MIIIVTVTDSVTAIDSNIATITNSVTIINTDIITAIANRYCYHHS